MEYSSGLLYSTVSDYTIWPNVLNKFIPKSENNGLWTKGISLHLGLASICEVNIRQNVVSLRTKIHQTYAKKDILSAADSNTVLFLKAPGMAPFGFCWSSVDEEAALGSCIWWIRIEAYICWVLPNEIFRTMPSSWSHCIDTSMQKISYQAKSPRKVEEAAQGDTNLTMYLSFQGWSSKRVWKNQAEQQDDKQQQRKHRCCTGYCR